MNTGPNKNLLSIVRRAGAKHQPERIPSLDMLENDTRNQHFVTQGEQRLNALNPQADPSNLRIYSFEVVDRENYILALESPNGRPIGSNLSLFDLFSFDVPGDSRLRLNFESAVPQIRGLHRGPYEEPARQTQHRQRRHQGRDHRPVRRQIAQFRA